ncbi:hypothetical protein ACTGJ9_017980 [Bradyrhizobium sp. RDM12]
MERLIRGAPRHQRTTIKGPRSWQYNVHRGQNGEKQQAPTAKIGLLANASLRVEPYTTPYQIMPHP